MAQGGLARKEFSGHTYTTKQTKQQLITENENNVKISFSGFEKILLTFGVFMTFLLLFSIVSVKNATNVSQRTLQNITNKSSHLNNENQSMDQALDATENNAINRIVKKDNLSIADSSVRDVTR